MNANFSFSQQTYYLQAQSLQVRMLLTSTVGISFCTNDCSPEPQFADLSTNMFSNLIEVEQSEDARELDEGELTHINHTISFKHLRASRWLVRFVMVIHHSVMSLGAWTDPLPMSVELSPKILPGGLNNRLPNGGQCNRISFPNIQKDHLSRFVVS